MQDGPSHPASDPQVDRLIDRWLRFAPSVDRQYEAEHRLLRRRHLKETIYVGLALFNVHNLTNAFLMPDIIWPVLILILCIVTPIAICGSFYGERMSATLRERMSLLLVLTAIACEIAFFSVTSSPLGNYGFAEFGLTLVYGNMLLALRFRHAVMFTALSFLLACVAVWYKPGVDDMLRMTFVVQVMMACFISLYANYKTERRRCRDYVIAHLAVTRATQSEAAKQHFEDQSATDMLTGLPNRRLLDEHIGTLFRSDLQAAVMMIDVDYFKLFNDTLGHPAGDDCLRQIGKVLGAAQTRDVLCARYGGEEFVMVVKGIDEVGAARMANAVVRSIETLGIAHPGRLEGERVVTISVGVAIKASGRAALPRDVLAAADQSLYRAKRMGRNRFVMHDGADHTIGTAAA